MTRRSTCSEGQKCHYFVTINGSKRVKIDGIKWMRKRPQALGWQEVMFGFLRLRNQRNKISRTAPSTNRPFLRAAGFCTIRHRKALKKSAGRTLSGCPAVIRFRESAIPPAFLPVPDPRSNRPYTADEPRLRIRPAHRAWVLAWVLPRYPRPRCGSCDRTPCRFRREPAGP